MVLTIFFVIRNLGFYIIIQWRYYIFRFKDTGSVISVGDIMMMRVFIVTNIVFPAKFHNEAWHLPVVVMRHDCTHQQKEC